MTKTLSDCHHDAVILSSMLEGIDLMDNEGKLFDNSKSACIAVALQRAQTLANDLDKLEIAK